MAFLKKSLTCSGDGCLELLEIAQIFSCFLVTLVGMAPRLHQQVALWVLPGAAGMPDAQDLPRLGSLGDFLSHGLVEGRAPILATRLAWTMEMSAYKFQVLASAGEDLVGVQ
jgi:hypothetical protein